MPLFRVSYYGVYEDEVTVMVYPYRGSRRVNSRVEDGEILSLDEFDRFLV